MRERIHSSWTLRGVKPYFPYGQENVRQFYATDKIPATVPGGIHLDLFRAGLIPNPYVGQNSLCCEWTEHRWWLYETEVTFDSHRGNKRFLDFAGLDYACDIYIDGAWVGSHENMFTRKRIDITHIGTDSFQLAVLFHGAPEELGQYGSTSQTRTQKSRFGYGWDFGTRLVNIGIWQEVSLVYLDEVEITDLCVASDYVQGAGVLRVQLTLAGTCGTGIDIEICAPDGQSIARRHVDFAEQIDEMFSIDQPQLWYPNGMGAQPLYRVNIRCGTEACSCRTGIRSLSYCRTAGAPEDALPYAAVINGKTMQLRGVNKVPFDHLYGNVDRDTCEWYISAMANASMNLVRLWGGGILGTETFYDLCDEYGIMVWQDFIQSSSHIEHIPSKRPEFLEKLRDASEEGVKRIRNHVSLLYWCGGNELTDGEEVPITYEDANIAMLKGIVEREDPQRLFLPSTSSGPIYRISFTEQNHDAHGPWEYDYKTHYRSYNALRIMFHAEFGANGPGAAATLFLRENRPDPDTWNDNVHHGEYWWHSYRRDKAIFGEFDDADSYIPYGQWIQAEALRYVTESERRKSPETCGSMIWQLNEPWPNSDCTNLVDYFGNPKMAYYWVQKAYSDCGVSCRYDGIYKKDSIAFTVCRDGDIHTGGKVDVEILHTDGHPVERLQLDFAQLPVTVAREFPFGDGLCMVRLTHNGITKEYFFSGSEECPYGAAKAFPKAQLSWQLSETEDGRVCAVVKNGSNVPAFFVRPEEKTLGYAVLADDAFFTLMPGEEKQLKLRMRKRLGLFFPEETRPAELTFACLNG